MRDDVEAEGGRDDMPDDFGGRSDCEGWDFAEACSVPKQYKHFRFILSNN